MRHAIITGGAGFIGSNFAELLVAEGNWKITIIDNFDPFYDPAIKQDNISQFKNNPNVVILNENICNLEGLRKALQSKKYDVIIHLAAKAGVRPSIEDPLAYGQVNVTGTHNMLEIAKEFNIKQFVFASSSSVYGINANVPWKESDYILKPISPYASTKVSGELLGHVYSHLYGIRFIALRFFTVFGPRQRPDLAIHKFSKLMMQGLPIGVYGDGSTKRDYTYVEDIAKGIRSAIDYEKTNYEIINLGNNRTVSMKELIIALENTFKVKAKIQRLPEQPGDVPQTFADIEKAKVLLNYRPSTTLEHGLLLFKGWMMESVSKKLL